MSNATGKSYNELGNTETVVCVDGAGTIVDNGLGGTEGKVDIVAKKKQIDANRDLLYNVLKEERNPNITRQDQ